MATEPRKPKFTNRKVLNVGASISFAVGYLSLIATMLWPPALFVGTAGVILSTILMIMRMRLGVWQVAQWEPFRSNVSRVTTTFLAFNRLLKGELRTSELRSVTLELDNGHTIEVSRPVYDSLGDSDIVTYESRVLGGSRKFRNVTGH